MITRLWLSFVLVLWVALCTVPDGRVDARSRAVSEPEVEQIFTSHRCATGRWYYENSDSDSVTVACYPDENAPDPEK